MNLTSQQDTKNWDNLKQVIADSTGFEKWKRSRLVETQNDQSSDQKLIDQKLIDELVTSYLRETLETLAY
jgi:hypothetical protein